MNSHLPPDAWRSEAFAEDLLDTGPAAPAAARRGPPDAGRPGLHGRGLLRGWRAGASPVAARSRDSPDPVRPASRWALPGPWAKGQGQG